MYSNLCVLSAFCIIDAIAECRFTTLISVQISDSDFPSLSPYPLFDAFLSLTACLSLFLSRCTMIYMNYLIANRRTRTLELIEKSTVIYNKTANCYALMTAQSHSSVNLIHATRRISTCTSVLFDFSIKLHFYSQNER